MLCSHFVVKTCSNFTINILWCVEGQSTRLIFIVYRQLSSSIDLILCSYSQLLPSLWMLDSFMTPFLCNIQFSALRLLPFYWAISYFISKIKIKSHPLIKLPWTSTELVVMSTVSHSIDIGTISVNIMQCNLLAQMWISLTTVWYSGCQILHCIYLCILKMSDIQMFNNFIE